MRSATLPSFWEAYASLDESVKRRAKKAFQLWEQNPFHPSLHFKCINREENIWSVRITRGYRAVGVLEGDTVTWFWIGHHDDYERFFS
ncbi:MAG: hypothetical protein D6802_01685 [Ardenticatenia bacterium]|nr:MAG: hypothetical protein D6802_01685 [Ardenticatenia bacterium]